MRIVYADIIGDLFHAGHVSFLKKARELGDQLFVGVNADEVCERYKRKTILTLAERVSVIEACRYVDRVIPGAPAPISTEFIQQYDISVVVHADDMEEKQLAYWYRSAIELGIFTTVPYTPGISTSMIIARIESR